MLDTSGQTCLAVHQQCRADARSRQAQCVCLAYQEKKFPLREPYGVARSRVKVTCRSGR